MAAEVFYSPTRACAHTEREREKQNERQTDRDTI